MNRTLPQNSSIHVYFRALAEELNNAGYDVRTTIKVPVNFTEEIVKNEMFRPIIKAMFDTDSTKKLSTVQIQEAYEVFNKFTAEKFGISIDWPHREEL